MGNQMTGSARTRLARARRSALCALVSLVMAISMVPTAAFAVVATSSYGWYTGHAGTQEDPYLISSKEDFAGFAEVVNGTATIDGKQVRDSFAGKHVKLANSINFVNREVVPAGGADGKTFDGDFDGAGYTLNNFSVQATRTENLGVFGATGEGSSVHDVVLGSKAKLSVSEPASSTRAIRNVGLLIGSAQGSVANVTSSGSLAISHGADQSRDLVFPVQNIGGIVGSTTGELSSCATTAAASITISEPGKPYTTGDTTDKSWEDQSVIVVNVGGVVGCFGDQDSSMDNTRSDKTELSDERKAERKHGSIANCSNASTISIDTPCENGEDRFHNKVYSNSGFVGGIAGYSRGSISGCSNSGKLIGEHMANAGGIVGSLRGKMATSSYSGNFTQEGFDDGFEADTLTISDCTNSGMIYGYSFPAGIVSRTGTYVDVTRCINEASACLAGTRPNKPFVSGIVGSTYGTVSYCANFGWVMSGTWNSPELGPEAGYSLGAGYFVSGIAGNASYFTKPSADDASVQVRKSPLPEVYGCLSAGKIDAVDNMRQRLLVGDNAGYLHDSVGIKGKCYNDRLAYGMYSSDTETSGGTVSNVVAVDVDVAQSNGAIGVLQEDGTYANPNEENNSLSIDLSTTVVQLLNTLCPREGWECYWAKSDGTVNNGYPVLSTQVTWQDKDLSSAEVSLAANAPYSGIEAVPQARVVLDGVELMQGVDFKVIPEKGAVELCEGTPHTATIEGIGAYSGTARQQLAYGISKGEMKSCTVSIDPSQFNWKAQFPEQSAVHVYNSAGVEMPSSEYAYAFDQTDGDLTVNPDTGEKEAVDAKRYTLVISAVDGEGMHFTGSTTGEFPIKTAKILVDPDATRRDKNAVPTGITFQGKSYDWESNSVLSDKKEQPHTTLDYTGYPVKPTVNSVVYKDRDLVLNTDYRVVYGASLLDGETVEAGKENLGVAGGTGVGYVTARYIPGGNFSNYEIMPFNITDVGALDLSQAEIRGDGPVIYEEGSAYRPIRVYYGGSQLTEGVDYTISYSANDAIGTASYAIQAVEGSHYTGGKSGTFEIVKGNAYSLTYQFDDNAGTAAVTGVNYTGSRDSFGIEIPATVENGGRTYTVTAIADRAFGGNGAGELTGANAVKKRISSVHIPATVQTIGKYAFGSESNVKWNDLAEVVFDDIDDSQLTEIGEGAFQGCGNISELVLPAKLATIGNRAFSMGAANQPAKLHKITFLTTDPTLPSNVGKTLTFTGVGYDGKTVDIVGYESAAAVKQLAEDNATNDAKGVNKGRNFKFTAVPDPEPEPDPEPPATTSIERLAGDDSWQTAVAISKAAFDSADAVILAKSTDFMDAMAATGLAGILNAPILLTPVESLEGEVAAEIERLGASKIIVIGGVNAVSPHAFAQCEDLVGQGNVERIAGNEAYDTSVECAKAIAAQKAAAGEACDKAVVAYSQNFQDALSISSFAYKYHVPIILETYGALSSDRWLSADGAALLTTGAFKDAEVFVPGGNGAVSTASVEGVIGAERVGDRRIGGEDGYDTSNKIAVWMTTHGDSASAPYLSARYVALACGAELAHGTDALAGAALAGKAGGVVLLANGQPGMDSVNTVTIDGFLTDNADSVDQAWVLGGGYVMPSALYDRVAALIGAN